MEWKPSFYWFQVEPFRKSTGPTTAIPVAIVKCSLAEECAAHSWTNRLVSESGDTKFATWEQVTVEELMAFVFLMGLNRLPALFDYWRLDLSYHYAPLQTRSPGIASLGTCISLTTAISFHNQTQILTSLAKLDQLLTVWSENSNCRTSQLVIMLLMKPWSASEENPAWSSICPQKYNKAWNRGVGTHR